jgi:lactoylglutathione lyase
MLVQKVHHVAYRCIDAKETVQWYEKHLDMKFVLAIAEDEVPDQGRRPLHAHLLDAGGGNILAFFELPSQPPMDRDRNTPAWVQHLALKVDSAPTLLATKARLEAAGIEAIGTDHTIFKSIYFFDPNGHRLELAADTGTPEMMQKLDAVKWDARGMVAHQARPQACGLDARRQHEPAGLSAPIERASQTHPTHPPSDIPL